MLFEFIHTVCYSSICLHGTIAWRLLRQGRELSFINKLFTLHFVFTTVATSLYLYFFLKLGSVSLFMRDQLDQDEITTLCVHYIQSFIGLYTVGSLPSFGIIFCRFIYARYAHGLVADKGRLFHKIVLLVIIIFTFHHLLLWYLDSQKDYRNRIKGRICNQIEFPDKSNKEFHVKQKLLTSIGVSLYMVALIFFQHTASRQKRVHNIPKRRQNLMTMNQHILYNHLIGVCLLFDQLILDTFLQVFHTSLGPHTILQIWWAWHLIMFCLVHILAPLCIFYHAMRHFPEFNGLKARNFPGQEKPRTQALIPKREFFTKKENCRESEPMARGGKQGGSNTRPIISVLPIIREEN